MDNTQTIKIPLQEYLELKEAFDRKLEIHLTKKTFHTGQGFEGLEGSSVDWKLSGATETEISLVGDISDAQHEYNSLYARVVSHIKDLVEMTPRQAKVFLKDLKSVKDAETWVKENFFKDGTYPIKLTSKNVKLPEGWALKDIKDSDQKDFEFELTQEHPQTSYGGSGGPAPQDASDFFIHEGTTYVRSGELARPGVTVWIAKV
jgi:hypothetical protein